jgi:hypothetical protein
MHSPYKEAKILLSQEFPNTVRTDPEGSQLCSQWIAICLHSQPDQYSLYRNLFLST